MNKKFVNLLVDDDSLPPPLHFYIDQRNTTAIAGWNDPANNILSTCYVTDKNGNEIDVGKGVDGNKLNLLYRLNNFVHAYAGHWNEDEQRFDMYRLHDKSFYSFIDNGDARPYIRSLDTSTRQGLWIIFTRFDHDIWFKLEKVTTSSDYVKITISLVNDGTFTHCISKDKFIGSWVSLYNTLSNFIHIEITGSNEPLKAFANYYPAHKNLVKDSGIPGIGGFDYETSKLCTFLFWGYYGATYANSNNTSRKVSASPSINKYVKKQSTRAGDDCGSFLKIFGFFAGFNGNYYDYIEDFGYFTNATQDYCQPFCVGSLEENMPDECLFTAINGVTTTKPKDEVISLIRNAGTSYTYLGVLKNGVIHRVIQASGGSYGAGVLVKCILGDNMDIIPKTVRDSQHKYNYNYGRCSPVGSPSSNKCPYTRAVGGNRGVANFYHFNNWEQTHSNAKLGCYRVMYTGNYKIYETSPN